MRKTNNFPREGVHQTVTRDAVEQLQSERPVLNHEVHYTIGGAIETQVHTNLYAEREAAITNGERSLIKASNDLRMGIQAAKPDERVRYIQAQREAAGQTFNQKRSR